MKHLCTTLGVLGSMALTVGMAGQALAANKAPDWVKHGTFVYRISTPDAPNVLDGIEAGTAIFARLTDGTVRQVPIMNGILGHDHPGSWNWDGAWPDWTRVTFRANHDWTYLHDFMLRARDRNNTYPSFHVNLTDVNVGLKDYPETQAFFQQLVAAKAIYRRDWNQQTAKRDVEPPYVPQAIPQTDNPVEIFALVNYKNFWDSGLAKQMIDDLYVRLPYAPPLLYLDVLTLGGGNFATGYPDGPLGGSQETQREGRQAIVDYLRSKGTDVATEGSGTMHDIGSTYAWLHGQGISADDYSQITGGHRDPIFEQTVGGAGAFNVSPIALTHASLQQVREHYRLLLAGKRDKKVMPDLSTGHVCIRNKSDEFDIPGTGDPFRGDFADLTNNFYLTTIQELYHIGKGNTRTKRLYRAGISHLRQFALTDADGVTRTIEIPAFTATEWARKGAMAGRNIMLEDPITTSIDVPTAGLQQLTLTYYSPGDAAANIYVNDKLLKTLDPLPSTGEGRWTELNLGQVALQAGRNTITIDSGPIRAEWDDGTQAVWTTPYLGTGFTVTNGDVTFAQDYDRMWPDTWSGQQKIYFFSWDGVTRAWTLPQEWEQVTHAMCYPLTPDGRGTGVQCTIKDRNVTLKLLPQVPYILVPAK